MRGNLPGYCGFFASASTAAARRRVETFVATTDGFALAEADFELRGPGEILGSRQHGLPPLRIADLQADHELLEETRQAAGALMQSDPGLALPEHVLLRQRVIARYGRTLELGEVG